MSLLWLSLRLGFGVLSLSLVILSIPLAFDLGGKDCGLSFSLALATFFFVLSTLWVAAPSEQRFLRSFVRALGFSQYIVIPGLLIYNLDRWSPKDGKSGYLRNGTEFGETEGQMWEKFSLGWWGWFLKWSTPMFQLLEGFCTLLVIQTFGHISRWLVNRERSDGWMVRMRPWIRCESCAVADD